MEVLPEVEPELEEAALQEEEEGRQDEGLSELRELEETLARVQIAPSAAHLLEPNPDIQSSEWPVSYRENSTWEKQLQSMADNFYCQYTHLYPNRKPLLLCPVNECGVQKFVSTTLQPTLLPYPELYDWQGSASFVSDFLSLEPLDPPVDVPNKLRSPTWTQQTRKGTCFEFSTLLCSLLLGAGYNAYCVSGYAVKEMCLLNLKRQKCPLLKPEVKEEVVKQKQENRKYTVKPPRDLSSSFEERQEQKRLEKAHAALLSQQLEAQRLQEERECPPPDPLLGWRVHCWVLVLSGNREVPENFFIDPLAGQSYPTTSDKFLGIESIWNHKNYWVNMQDCRFGCTEMTFDLGNPIKWEYLLCGSTNQYVPLSSDTENQYNQEDEEEEDEEPKKFDMPPSWVSKIHISQEDMDGRYPGGTKLIQYRQATVEKFAPYLLKDGLLTRLTTYTDQDCTQPNTVKEWYKHRHDHLEERELRKATSTTTEHFSPGRSDALKCHRYLTLDPETERQMDFYFQARYDGLVSRVETHSEMTETFEERVDFLYHRHVVYGMRVQSSGPEENSKQVQRPIKMVVEKFHRDCSKAASEDVAKRVFLLSEDQIQVTYHQEEDRIIPAWQNFIKPLEWQDRFTPQMASSFQVDPQKKPEKKMFLHKTLIALMAEEKKVIAGIKLSEEEVRAILDARQQEERTIKLQISIYNTAGNEKALQMAELKRLAQEELLPKEEEEMDVLAPFLVKMGNPKSLTQQQAEQLKVDCLAELKQRLVDRANLIQARFEKEKHDLQQKQQWYQKNQLTMTKKDEDAYLAYCSDATFRIHVLQLRLNRHKDKAPQMYLTLKDTLRHDPRLSQHLC